MSNWGRTWGWGRLAPRGRAALTTTYTDITDRPGTNKHKTRWAEGTLPTALLLTFRGTAGEHLFFQRTPHGKYGIGGSGELGEGGGPYADWPTFVEEIRRDGIQTPVSVRVMWTGDLSEWDRTRTVRGRWPRFAPSNPRPLDRVEAFIDEGNHRVRAAAELGLTEVPVNVVYFGHADKVLDLARR